MNNLQLVFSCKYGFSTNRSKKIGDKTCRELYNLEWVFEFFFHYVLHKQDVRKCTNVFVGEKN